MASDDSIDFGGRFARQFFENNWPNLDDEPSPVPIHHQHHHHQSSTNPITSTPIASDNSICDSGYESLNQHRKSSTSPTSSFQHGLLDVNNNNVNCQTPTSTKQQTMASVASAAAAIAAAVSLPSVSSSSASSLINSGCTTTLTSVGGGSSSSSTSALSGTQLVATNRPSSSPLNNNSSGGGVIIGAGNSDINNNHTNIGYHNHRHNGSTGSGCCNHSGSNACSTSNSSANNQSNAVASLTADDLAKLSAGIGLMKLIMTPDVVVRQQRSNSLFTTTPAMATSLSATNPWSSQDLYQRFSNVDKIERAASLHRTAASYSEPQYTWSGQLPSRSYKNPVFSCKVFLGGVPWDVTEQGLIETFGRFGPLRVQWPGKDIRHQSGQTKHGYVYLIYESERYVKALLQACTQDFGAGSHPEKYYYQISSRRMRFKEVQVIPWVLADSNYIRNQSGRPDSHRTVFVGALHGMLTAEGLAKVMNDLFGGVAYVGIDSDKHKYPLGSGRVTFINQRSYMKAVSAGFIEVKSSQFCKKIQVDPYLEPSQCSTCHIQSAPIFCRDCLRYFCKTCWNWHHSTESIAGKQHLPLMRKKRET